MFIYVSVPICPWTCCVRAHSVSMHLLSMHIPSPCICMPRSECQHLMKVLLPMHTHCPCAHLQDLYAKICGVSYIGDVRMGFAEDSRKIERIASGSAEGLALMYNKRLQVGTCSFLCTAHPVTFAPMHPHPCTHTRPPHSKLCVAGCIPVPDCTTLPSC